MNEQKDPKNQTHKEATSLPWYLAGTLTKQEKDEVEAHLTDCSNCRAELEDMKRIREAVKTTIQEREGPSPELFSKVMARIHEEEEDPTPIKSPVIKEEVNWWAGIQARLQSLYTIPWVPALATILIVSQATLLLTKMGEQSGPYQQPGPIIERGIPKASIPKMSSTIQVGFREDAKEGDIRTLLQEINGRIVNGPSPQGIYILEVPISDSIRVEATLQTLRARSNLVRLAESVHP